MVTTLRRASPAREAVKTVALLADAYGYASSMEGFSISDGVECWYMELIGKGDLGTGLLWVALRVPDGYFTANVPTRAGRAAPDEQGLVGPRPAPDARGPAPPCRRPTRRASRPSCRATTPRPA